MSEIQIETPFLATDKIRFQKNQQKMAQPLDFTPVSDGLSAAAIAVAAAEVDGEVAVATARTVYRLQACRAEIYARAYPSAGLKKDGSNAVCVAGVGPYGEQTEAVVLLGGVRRLLQHHALRRQGCTGGGNGWHLSDDQLRTGLPNQRRGNDDRLWLTGRGGASKWHELTPLVLLDWGGPQRRHSLLADPLLTPRRL